MATQSKAKSEEIPSDTSQSAAGKDEGKETYLGTFSDSDLTAATSQEEAMPTYSDRLDPKDVKKIIQEFALKCETDEKLAIIGIAKLVQDGGTNASKTELIRTINGKKFDIKVLRTVINFINKNGTVRKLAKAMRNTIARISSLNNWPGPLVKELTRMDPQLEIKAVEAIYCNEIFTDCYETHVPARIRESLILREKQIRETRKTLPPKAAKKKKSPRGKK